MRVCVLSHQTLQKPGRSGDDDEELLGQLCDEGYFRALGTLIGLGGDEQGQSQRRFTAFIIKSL